MKRDNVFSFAFSCYTVAIYSYLQQLLYKKCLLVVDNEHAYKVSKLNVSVEVADSYECATKYNLATLVAKVSLRTAADRGGVWAQF